MRLSALGYLQARCRARITGSCVAAATEQR